MDIILIVIAVVIIFLLIGINDSLKQIKVYNLAIYENLKAISRNIGVIRDNVDMTNDQKNNNLEVRDELYVKQE